MTVFSLFVTTLGVYAWFNYKMNETAEGTDFSVYSDNTNLTYSIYKYDVSQDSPTCVDGETSNGFVLNQYDVVFKERNKYNPVYLEIQMSGALLSESGSINFILERDPTYPAMDSNNNLSEYFSSVTRYAVASNGVIANGIHDPTSVQNTWNNLNTVFYERDVAGTLSTQLFTSGTTGNYTKNNSLSFIVNYTQSDYVDSLLYVYLYINYDTSLTEQYSYEHGLNSQSIGGAMNYTLTNDLTSIHIERNQ